MMTDDIKKNWENLCVPEPILLAIEKEGFLKPTEIQKLTLPFAIRDRLDILGAAATGTGKTLAFGIPLISRVLEDKKREIDEFEAQQNIEESDVENDVESDDEINDDEECEDQDLEPSGSELEDTWNDGDINPEVSIAVGMIDTDVDIALPYKHIYGLVLTPTRELACQVADHLKKMCQFTDLKVCVIFGGMSIEKQERQLSYRPEIVVVTPGRFWSFIKDQNQHALTANKMSVLVFDEADRLLESGHFAEIDNLLEWLKTNEIEDESVLPRQTFVFSATLTFVHASNQNDKRKVRTTDDKLRKCVSKLGMKCSPKIIDTTLDVAQLKQWKINCPSQPDKDSRLFWFLKYHPGRTIVFVNSKNSVRRLTSVMQQTGLHPKSLFADMPEKQRLKNLETFTKSENGILIASDVAARGLDIPRVDYVIHFDVAHTAETHLHRSGRTARATNPGHSIIMLTPKEMAPLRKLLFSLKKSEDDLETIPIDDIKFVEEIVKLARKVEANNHISSKIDKDKDWFTKMAEAADIALDEEFAPVINKSSGDKVAAAKMKMELDTMLKRFEKTRSSYKSPISAPVPVAQVTPGSDHIATVVRDHTLLRQNRKKKMKATKVTTKGSDAAPEKKRKLE